MSMWLFFLKNPGNKKMHALRLCVCAVLKLSSSEFLSLGSYLLTAQWK